MESVNISSSKKLENNLKKDLLEAKNNEKFVKLINKLKINDDIAIKYTSYH